MTTVDQASPRTLGTNEVETLLAQPVWTVKETARFLRVGERVIRKLVADGRVTAYQIGRWIRIPRDRLLEDLDRGNIGATDTQDQQVGA